MTRKGLDVSHTDVSDLKALNMTDKGNMTKEDMTKLVILNECEESNQTQSEV